MRKILLILLILVFAVQNISAKGSGSSGDSNGVVKFVAVTLPNSLEFKVVSKFADELERLSENTMKVERYLTGQLALNDEDQLTAVSENAAQIVFTGDLVFSWVAPEWLSYTSIPYAFQDAEHMRKFFLGKVGKEINQKLIEKHGMRFLDNAIITRPPRNLTANKKITSPQDMDGLKFRVPNVIGTVKSWEAFGAKVIGVPWAELFSALQTGVVEAEENPYPQIETFYQVQKYIMESGHQIAPQEFIVNEKFYQSLNNEQRKALLGANAAAVSYSQEMMSAEIARIKEKILQNGNIIVPRSEIDVPAFKAIIKDKVLDSDLTKDWAPGGWDYIQSLAN